MADTQSQDFNPERLRLAASSLRLARVCLADAFAHAITRETFGKKLIENQIIRVKFAACGRLIEPAHAFLEQLVYMVSESKAKGLDIQIGGMTALLKIMSTQALEQALRESQQIMGGLGFFKNGKGARIEQISRDLRVMVIGGGSEEIMSDLAIRQEMQYMHTQAKAKL